MIRGLTLAAAVALVSCTSTGDGHTDGSAGENGMGGDGSGGESSGSGGESSGTGGGSSGPPPPGASRTSGLAPLYVFFDATDGYSPEERIAGTFKWDFDTTGTDPDAPYLQASGFVAGHVFEQPGRYVVRVEIDVPNRDTKTAEWTIDVGEFDGPIVYVAADGDDANDGAMDAPIQTIQEAFTRAVPGTRVLFRNGDVFETAGAVDAEGEGPVLIGAYSDPDDPSDAKPELHNTDVDGATYFFRVTTEDWRFQDLLLTTGGHTTGDGGPQYPSMFDLLPGTMHTLFAGLEIREYGTTGVSLGGDANAVYQTDISRFGRTGVYAYDDNGRRNSLIGNTIHGAISDHPEHVVRIQQSTHMFVGFNHFQSAHNKSNTQLRGNSHDIVVYKNVLDRLVGIQPKNDDSEEYVHTCVVDSNLVIGRTNDVDYNPEYPLAEAGVVISATNITIRNNVIYGFSRGVRINDHPLVGTSERIGIFNNTFVCNPATGGCGAVQICDGCSDINIGSNIFFDPSSSSSGDRFVDADSAGWLGSSDYNVLFGSSWDEGHQAFSVGQNLSLEDWQAASGQDMHSQQADPQLMNFVLDETATEDTSFTVDDLQAENLFVPMSTGPGVDLGTEIGIRGDLFDEARDTEPDSGAVESQD